MITRHHAWVHPTGGIPVTYAETGDSREGQLLRPVAPLIELVLAVGNAAIMALSQAPPTSKYPGNPLSGAGERRGLRRPLGR